ncbi:hypothetical protein [Limibacterium fermenti]|uniref:hypothetical protein n=1 Tax=Limibacterium fermenti TaxID=3229863 RepID=UPI000E822E56|nr:hypothetical protein [Porphyromonadaceae bacterium]
MTTDIHRLLDRYFQGGTTTEEEKTLRRFFAQENLPEEWHETAAIFRFLEDESTALKVLKEIQREEALPVRRTFRLKTIVTVAAAACALIALLLVLQPGKGSSSEAGSYVWVDGQRITDPAVVQRYAELSFDKVQTENNIITEQLQFMTE